MRPIRTLVVDDEALARRRLRDLLRRRADVELVGECKNGAEAVAAIRDASPDLVFLDVRMPDLSGFDVLEALGPGRRPLVVFVTAYDDHALRAFEVHAVDYLLKPFEDERLHEALERARLHLLHRSGEELWRRLRALLDDRSPAARPEPVRLPVKIGARTVFLLADEVDHVAAEGSYVRLFAGGRELLLRESLARLEARLAPAGFLRVHRSSLVNLARVRELRARAAGEVLVLADGTELRIGERHREPLRRALGL